MKKFLALLFICLLGITVSAAAPKGWLTDYDQALAQAKAEKKSVFVLFTGSDWCPWCVRLHKDVLDKPEFKNFAAEKLVTVYMDFPRRNPLPAEQLKKQRELSDKLKAGNGVPAIVIVSPDGKVKGRIGYMPLNKFMRKLQKVAR